MLHTGDDFPSQSKEDQQDAHPHGQESLEIYASLILMIHMGPKGQVAHL